MVDFSEFDKQVNGEQLKKDIDAAIKNGISYREVLAGTYTCDLEKLEVGTTKDGRPMLKGMFRIIGDENGGKSGFEKNCLFFNRVLYGTKNDANMISSAVGWLNNLNASEDVGNIVFDSYSQFAELVMDIAEDVMDDLRYIVDYDPDEFNNIAIIDSIDKN